MLGQQSGATGTRMSSVEQFLAGGGQFPAGFTGDQTLYAKSRLLEQNQQMTPQQVAQGYLDRGQSIPPQVQDLLNGMAPQDRAGTSFASNGTPAGAVSQPGTAMVQFGQQGQGLQGGLQGGLPGGGTDPMAGIPPQLLQTLMASIQGQGAPQAAAPPPIDPGLMQAIQNQLNGVGQPTFQDIVQGTFEPMSNLMDQQFQTAQTQAFEQLISRGVLQSGETQNTITRMAQDLGMSKGALLGQLALDYSKQRNEQITNAIQQWGILENNRATNATTITAANLQAAVSIQQTAMQTLTTLTTAMAQIQSAEKIAGADISSREKIAGMQIGSNERIAGMDIASRQAIAEMQAQTQRDVANIGAQAALQIANGNKELAHQEWTGRMALEGIDWDRFLTDPVYAAKVTNAIAIEKDGHFAIDQADAVDRQLPDIRV